MKSSNFHSSRLGTLGPGGGSHAICRSFGQVLPPTSLDSSGSSDLELSAGMAQQTMHSPMVAATMTGEISILSNTRRASRRSVLRKVVETLGYAKGGFVSWNPLTPKSAAKADAV